VRPAILLSGLGVLCGCSSDEAVAPTFDVVVATFNTGTTENISLTPDDDSWGEEQAVYSDQYYGNGLAWAEVVEDTRRFFANTPVDVVAFQEMFYSGDCPGVPEEARPGFVCETWKPGEPTVAQVVVGEGFQVACNLGKPDKCLAVRKSFGQLVGCDADLCLDGLDGAEVPDCGSGSRVGRGVITRPDGASVTVVAVHGTSGLEASDQACRGAQFAQIFEDLDGAPAANGDRNIILGDFNTDPGRNTDFDEGAQLVAAYTLAEGAPFHFVSEVGPDAEPTYARLFNIDHVIADAYDGSCWVPGISEGEPAVTTVNFFDHHPIVCGLNAR